jgi:hypothetical protein
MSDTVVRVDLRQATLSDNARLREAGELLFLVLDNPPPVRSLLRIVEAEQHKAFEVARVVEVVEDGEPARGCYGRYIELERLDEQAKVGSEHLEPGISGSGGVPAPVVIMNTAEMMLGEGSEDAEAGEAGEDSEADADAGDSEAEGEASEASDEGEASEDSDEGEASEDSDEGEASDEPEASDESRD